MGVGNLLARKLQCMLKYNYNSLVTFSLHFYFTKDVAIDDQDKHKSYR